MSSIGAQTYGNRLFPAKLSEPRYSVAMATLPNPEHAVVEMRKLRGYCLNPEHPRGKHKARIFASALGLAARDSEELRQTLLSAALSEEATPAEEDEYGRRYVLDFEMSTEIGSARVRSGWIVRQRGLPEVHQLLGALGGLRR